MNDWINLTREIKNFIIWYSSDGAEREEMIEALNEYVSEMIDEDLDCETS